ncbi:MAG: hypothetical protein AAGD23_09070 [Pseudomonadota bacterium]
MQDVVEQLKALRSAAFERVAATQDYKLLTELDDMLARLDPDVAPLAPSAEPAEAKPNGAASELEATPALEPTAEEAEGDPVPDEMTVAETDEATQPDETEADTSLETAAVEDDAGVELEVEPATEAEIEIAAADASDAEAAEVVTEEVKGTETESDGLAGRAQALAGLAGAGAVAASTAASGPVEAEAVEEEIVTAEIVEESSTEETPPTEPETSLEEALADPVAEALDAIAETPPAEPATSETVTEQAEPEEAPVDSLVAAIEQAAAEEDAEPVAIAEPSVEQPVPDVASDPDPTAVLAEALEAAEAEQPADTEIMTTEPEAANETAADAATEAPSVPGLSEEAEMRPMQEVLAEALGQQPDFEAAPSPTPVADAASEPTSDEPQQHDSVMDQVAAAIQSDAGIPEPAETSDQVSALVEGMIDDPEPAAAPLDPPSADLAGLPGDLTEALAETAATAVAEPADVNLDAAENLDTSPAESDQKPDEAYESALSRLNALIERASERMKSDDVGTGS